MYVDCLQCQQTLLLFPLPISCFILAKRRGHAQFFPDHCYYRIVFVFSALLYFLNWSVSNRSTIYSRAVLHKLYVWRRCASAGQNTMPEIATFDRRWVIMQVFFLLSFAVINRHTNSAYSVYIIRKSFIIIYVYVDNSIVCWLALLCLWRLLLCGAPFSPTCAALALLPTWILRICFAYTFEDWTTHIA